MKRMSFDSQGKLLTIDFSPVDYSKKKNNESSRNKNYNCQICNRPINHKGNCFRCNIKKKRMSESNINNFMQEDFKISPNTNLKTSSSLAFLKEEKIENIFDKKYWSLYSGSRALEPLKFSNGKTQEDVVKEVVDLIQGGKKVIFLHGVCGTGKSAIALNIARALGKTSIIVPVKALQKQYEDDYMTDKYLTKSSGKKLKIAMITGRENHDSLILKGKSCAEPELPENIKITDKNYDRLKEYYLENPFTDKSSIPSLKNIRRLSIAPSNPYWSPILPSNLDIQHLADAKKYRYSGVNGKEFIFYHRKHGCSYYDQHLAYFDADAIIFNSAKYLSEFSLGRKPLTEVEIIDEGDEFLDSLSNQLDLNLTRLYMALNMLFPENQIVKENITEILDLIDLEEKNKRALGVDEDKVFHISETKIDSLLRIFMKNPDLEVEIEADEMNYANTALEAAKTFANSMKETYLTYRKEESDLIATLVTTNLSQKFKELVDGNKALVFMSGTLHSDSVLKNIFGISDFTRVEAETFTQGTIEIVRTGKEFDCKYSALSKKNSREDYLVALSEAISKAKKPILVHVNAFADLPSEKEVSKFDNLVSSEKLRRLQKEDKTGMQISLFKRGLKDILFSTKCSRGVDFPGETCNSIIFTKYPNPNVKDTFWKILNKTHPSYFWDFYKDKARREFLQKIYRALRSKEDHVYVLSPDIRVLNAVRELQGN